MRKAVKILEDIEAVKSELSRVKPRSQRKVELEDRLKTLVTRLLRKENRLSRRGESLLATQPHRSPSLG